jgi:hypothetical protein
LYGFNSVNLLPLCYTSILVFTLFLLVIFRGWVRIVSAAVFLIFCGRLLLLVYGPVWVVVLVLLILFFIFLRRAMSKNVEPKPVGSQEPNQ